MNRSWMLAAPAALALLVAGCSAADQPSNQISPVANASGGIGNAPGNPVSPNSPPAITASLTNTEAQAAPAPRTYSSSSRRIMRARPVPGYQSGQRAPAPGTEQTTSGPSAAGRIPASAQPVGNGGS